MRNFTMLFFISVMVVTLAGCGSTNEASANTKPCNLSTLKIKEIKIGGDKDGLLARAILSELYKRGAGTSEDGVEIVGSSSWNNATNVPDEVSVEVRKMAFASTVQITSGMFRPTISSRLLARRIADDFCKCSAANPPERPYQK